uniref:Uncharacterized protein n=1 Tax=Rhizophora mucronata TaxID=61149 RepID=A0A2P2PZL2_RHIMU
MGTVLRRYPLWASILINFDKNFQ